MKYWHSSLTKNVFRILTPNLIYNWDQIKWNFHKQFPERETRVSLMNIKKYITVKVWWLSKSILAITV